jgi:hypothetical protein
VVAGSVLLLLLLHISGMASAGTLPEAQRYADAFTGPKNLAAVVITRKLGGKRIMGSSEVVLKGGKMVLFRIVLNEHTLKGREADWQETIRHEFCHLLVARDLGYIPQPFHNSDFRRCARANGVRNDYVAD